MPHEPLVGRIGFLKALFVQFINSRPVQQWQRTAQEVSASCAPHGES